ncbi:MAG: hypothetical protein AB1894_17420 [Chloroflexota bacterium]
MRKPVRSNIFSIAIPVILCLLLASCKSSTLTNNEYSPTPRNEITPATSVFVQESAVVYTTFQEIVDNSDVILIGEPTDKMGIVNTARDPKDLSKEDPEIFSIGQVYRVRVENYLVGDGPNDILVIQHLGMIRPLSLEITDADIDEALKSFSNLPLTLDRQYIMFLSFASFDYGGYKKDNLYFGSGHPWRFEITSSGCVQLEDSFRELSEYFPLQTFDDFVLKINNPENYLETPSPAPEIPALCMPQNPKTDPVPEALSTLVPASPGAYP